MKKYLISLERDQARRELFFAQPNTSDFNLFSAINTMQETDESLQARFDFNLFEQRYGRKATKGEIGCTLSHLAIYQQILVDENIKDEDYVLVCEDDALFTDNFQAKLDALLPYCEADFIWVGQSKITNFNDSELEINYPIAPSFLCKKIENTNLTYGLPYKPYFAGTVAYLVRKQAVKKLLNFAKLPFWLADDYVLFQEQLGLVATAVRPLLAIENPQTISNLSQFRAEKYNNFWMKIAKYPLKKLFAIKRNM
ncbi:glycosyltransferase family 25 protein [Mannheimia sp. AT1]|uniref:Glycosyltransferase family 25 protein n=1 Tax=Mannheimia cairinae TaxID=3025936 RepID=A0ABT5MPW8_9PAST|nr:glycosyltransferase family 25 protein [Mannheimia cairinae]MDD0823536.1 glycosyltransferase family 25 protein [Mannheimia cairinae]MDD0826749.1 glycosyltransferase family 25 protein [Mannheimia cairinae]